MKWIMLASGVFYNIQNKHVWFQTKGKQQKIIDVISIEDAVLWADDKKFFMLYESNFVDIDKGLVIHNDTVLRYIESSKLPFVDIIRGALDRMLMRFLNSARRAMDPREDINETLNYDGIRSKPKKRLNPSYRLLD